MLSEVVKEKDKAKVHFDVSRHEQFELTPTCHSQDGLDFPGPICGT